MGALGLFLSVGIATGQETTESIGKKIARRAKATSAFHAEIENSVFTGIEFRREQKSRVVQDWQQSGRLIKWRIETRGQMPTADGSTKPLKHTSIRDGKMIYSWGDVAGRTVVTKDAAPSMPPQNPVLNARLRNDEVKLLPEAKVLGRPCWVLELTPHKRSRAAYTRQVSAFDQQTGIPLRIEQFDRRDRVMRRTVFKSFDTSRTAPYETFVFKALAGAKVIDKSSPSFNRRASAARSLSSPRSPKKAAARRVVKKRAAS